MPRITPVVAHVNAVGRASPAHEVHGAFCAFAEASLSAPRERALFRRMAARSGIARRRSSLAPATVGGPAIDTEGFYVRGRFPGTGARMRRYAETAPALAEAAVRDLAERMPLGAVTHLVLASCTGFCAPGVDQRLVDRLGLDPDVERVVLGFMGCAAAVNALKTARHIVRSEPDARVLVVCVELCTLHLQDVDDLETMLSAMLFADGAAAALVSAEPRGFALGGFRAVTIPATADRITWDVADTGFLMHLSGAVPAAIEGALARERMRNDAGGVLAGTPADAIALWAVHPGGRTVLDAVAAGLDLPEAALAPARAVLRENGNMSSPTVLFVLADLLARPGPPGEPGIGMAFGPGMVAETFRFARAA
ncbi:type III polyketide synthase [Salinarimonas chemoclinalis]|uniref:type III polyketide synthase n=1 Tax=Salinarimonas chemoclinalis TaxID=3241599 RepID=UPI003558BE48